VGNFRDPQHHLRRFREDHLSALGGMDEVVSDRHGARVAARGAQVSSQNGPPPVPGTWACTNPGGVVARFSQGPLASSDGPARRLPEEETAHLAGGELHTPGADLGLRSGPDHVGRPGPSATAPRSAAGAGRWLVLVPFAQEHASSWARAPTIVGRAADRVGLLTIVGILAKWDAMLTIVSLRGILGRWTCPSLCAMSGRWVV